MTSAAWARASSAPVQEHHPAWRNRARWSEQSPVSPQYDEGTKPSSAKNPPQISAPSPEPVSVLSSIPACPASCPLRDPPSPGNAPKQLTETAETANP